MAPPATDHQNDDHQPATASKEGTTNPYANGDFRQAQPISNGALAGIVIGAIIVILLVIALIVRYFSVRSLRAALMAEDAEAPAQPAEEQGDGNE